jgi:hypothetical protein
MSLSRTLLAAAVLTVACPAAAQAPAAPLNNADAGVPVFPYDIKDRPYEILGTIHAGVRKATIFSKESSQAKIYRELWERARKLGADAVVNATYGEAHISAFSWGKTNASGTAIRFVKQPEASEMAATAVQSSTAAEPTPAAQPAPAAPPSNSATPAPTNPPQ